MIEKIQGCRNTSVVVQNVMFILPHNLEKIIYRENWLPAEIAGTEICP